MNRKPEILDAEVLRTWGSAALEALLRQRKAVDQLNVFPVADSDTGTNMIATLQAACRDLEPRDDSVGALVSAAAQKALLSARGNSGVILAQMLRGFADAWAGVEVDGHAFASGLETASNAAHAAVAVPTHGTMLTVAAEAAKAATTDAPRGLVAAAEAAATAAAVAVNATPSQLPALARAGVVDSGGMGLALLLDSFVGTLTGTNPGRALRLLRAQRPGDGSRPFMAQVPRETGSADFAYEVQFLLDASSGDVERLRQRLSQLGDSLVIIGSAATGDPDELPTWNVHVHVNNIGASIEAGIETGRVHRLSVTRFDDNGRSLRPAELSAAVDSAGGEGPPGLAIDRSVVAVTDNPAMATLLRQEGCQVATESTVSAIGQGIRQAGAHNLIMLADGPAAQANAQEAASEARSQGWRVALIPTIGLPQILAAVAVQSTERRFDDDVIAMAEAAAACRVGQVRVARDSSKATTASYASGDALVVVDGDVLTSCPDISAATIELLSRLCSAGVELLTLIPGRELSDESVRGVVEDIQQRWPLVEIQRLAGGQAEPVLLIGAE